MAGENRPSADAVAFLESLRLRPYQFDFFQALRRLEAHHRDKPRLGQSVRPADDFVRLRQEPSLTFAPAALAEFEPESPGKPAHLTVLFAGLFGPNGPLPLHLTEYARNRIRHENDPTFSRFLDVFHHRLLSLFYRAWASAQPTTSYDRPESDRFSNYVGALIGIGMPSLRDRDALPDNARLHFAGRLACQTKNLDGLEAMLRGFFRTTMKVDEFVGHWLQLPHDCQSALGIRPGISTLGSSVVLGDQVWDCQTRFRIVGGPMSFAEYLRLLPGGKSLERLQAAVNTYVGFELAWELQLVLRKEETPPLQLGMLGQLGWTTWLARDAWTSDPRDLILQPQEAVREQAA